VVVSAEPRASIDGATVAGDLRAEGEPEKEFHPGIAARIPRKNVAAGALIRDRRDRILFVVPTYKPLLDIPGGLVEDDEAPKAACEREVAEELGLTLRIGALLVVDWIPSRGVWRDALLFVYDGGVLDDERIARIRLQAEELAEFRFLTLDEARPELRPSLARRLAVARDGRPVYAEFGHPG
jgi:8-oxo-dGTP pyrophosphatase MutT (NUDIX family)